MRQGQMKYRLQMLRPSTDVDRFGAQVTAFVDAGTCWAERVAIAGRYGEDVAEMFHDYDATYNVRFEQPLCDGWRVKEVGGHLYDVVATVPNIARGMLTIKCVRVNE